MIFGPEFSKNETPDVEEDSGFESGGYLQVSPGLVGLIVDEHRFTDRARWLWPWSIAGGWMFAPSGRFRATLGLAFEHRMMFLEPELVHGLNALAEVRLGAAWRRVWVYGLLGVGGTGTFIDWRSDERPSYFYGGAFQYGGGVAGKVRSRLVLGVELDFDASYHPLVWRSHYPLEPFYYHAGSLEIVFGWSF